MRFTRSSGFFVSEALCLALLGLFEPQQKLIDWQALGSPCDAVTLQFTNDLTQPIDLVLMRRQHAFKAAESSERLVIVSLTSARWHAYLASIVHAPLV